MFVRILQGSIVYCWCLCLAVGVVACMTLGSRYASGGFCALEGFNHTGQIFSVGLGTRLN